MKKNDKNQPTKLPLSPEWEYRNFAHHSYIKSQSGNERLQEDQSILLLKVPNTIFYKYNATPPHHSY